MVCRFGARAVGGYLLLRRVLLCDLLGSTKRLLEVDLLSRPLAQGVSTACWHEYPIASFACSCCIFAALHYRLLPPCGFYMSVGPVYCFRYIGRLIFNAWQAVLVLCSAVTGRQSVWVS
jgi:hypothetical protein